MMSRTTLAIDDDVLLRIKQQALKQGCTVQALTNQLLRQALATPRRQAFRLRLSGWKARLQPGVDLEDRDSLFEHMDDGGA